MSPLHPYQRIAEVLQEEIGASIWPVGGKLPSRTALAARFHVSEMTISNAIRSLEQDGWLVRHQGKGVFVADPVNRKAEYAPHAHADIQLRVANLEQHVEDGLAKVFARLDNLEQRG